MNRVHQESLPGLSSGEQSPVGNKRKANPLQANRSAKIRSAMGRAPESRSVAGRAAKAADSSFWPRFKSELLNGNEHNKVFQSWLKDLCLSEEPRSEEPRPEGAPGDSQEMRLTLQLPSPLHKKWAAENILPLLQTRAGKHYGKPCQIGFQIRSASASGGKSPDPAGRSAIGSAVRRRRTQKKSAAPAAKDTASMSRVHHQESLPVLSLGCSSAADARAVDARTGKSPEEGFAPAASRFVPGRAPAAPSAEKNPALAASAADSRAFDSRAVAARRSADSSFEKELSLPLSSSPEGAQRAAAQRGTERQLAGLTETPPPLTRAPLTQEPLTQAPLTQAPPLPRNMPAEGGLQSAPSKIAPPRNSLPRLANRSKTAFFHPDYLFDNFIVGKNNEFAREACFCLTQRRSLAFNPIFIHGPSGVGKTHLLNALGWEFAAGFPEKRIHYLSAEKFLNECIHSIQRREMKRFQKKYRSRCDLLLLDDIQMIARGTAVQEEFFHTFNELFNRGAPVVLCCDSPPSRVPGLEDRLRSRMEGGLVAEISYPDWETRVAILKSKAERKGLEIPDKILFQIARNHRRSIREMEGALNKIKMLSDLKGVPLSLEYMQSLLEKAAPRPITALEIQKKTAKKFHVSLEEALSPSRKKDALLARQTAMYFIKTKLRKSLSDTGRLFGGKDHSTVVNGLKKIEKLKAKDPEFRLALDELEREMESCGAL